MAKVKARATNEELKSLLAEEIESLQQLIERQLGAKISKKALTRLYEDVAVEFLREFLKEQMAVGKRRENARKLTQYFAKD